VAGYRLDDREVGVKSPGRFKNFLHVVQTGSGVRPASPGIKRPGSEADHSLLTSAEVKKMLIYTPIPSYVFVA
jgi:hypothetical protein